MMWNMRNIHYYILGLMLAAGTVSSPAQNTKALSPRSKSVISVRKAEPEKTVSAYLTINWQTVDRQALENLGVKVCVVSDNIATVRIPQSKLEDVAEVEGVEYVQVSSPVSQMLDKARAEAGADKAAAGEGLSNPYTGKGVVIGIVDAGFDYTHAAFYDKDGNLRIKRVWEQAGTPSGSYVSPEAFGYGIELKTREEIETAGGDIMNNSHGTHVAGIAAGSDGYMDGVLKGVAPDADIVLVSMGETSRDNVNLTNALAYIFSYAEAEGKPCVVNLSLGSHAGPHDGTSTFDVMAGQLQGAGKLIVGSAGNHRSDKFHVTGTFSGSGDAPLNTFVQFKKAPSTTNKGGDIEIWGSKGSDFEVWLSAVNTATGDEKVRQQVYPSDGQGQSVTFGSYITGDFFVSSETSPLNGKPHVMLTSGVTNVRYNYAVAISVVPKGSGVVDIWADNTSLGLTDNGLKGFTGQTTESTIAEIGGTAKRIMTAGAYTTRNEYTLFGATTSSTLDETVGDIGSFSSCGPTADGRMKPDVTAPGCFIISSVSSNDKSGTQMVAYRYSGAQRDNIYGYMQGTSMASPFVAGAAALWLQAYPEMTPEDLAEIVRSTSRHDSFTGTDAGNDWGWGKIDVYGGLRKCIEKVASGCADITAPSDCVVRKVGDELRITFLSDGAQADISIVSAGGQTVYHSLCKPVSGEVRVDISSLPQGIYVLRVDAGNSSKTLKLRK